MPDEKVFLVEGELRLKGKKQGFSKKVKAKTAGFAAEKVLCLFGSKNRLKRSDIFISEAKEVEA